MKIFRFLALGFIGCIIVPFVPQAQSTDYLVTTSNDTLFGTVSGRKEVSIRISRNSEGNREIFSSDQVKLYHLHRTGKTYVSALVPHSLDPIFLLRIIEGPLELLEDTRKPVRSSFSPMSNTGMVSSLPFKSPARLFVRKMNTMFAGEVINKYVFKNSTKEERKDALLQLVEDDAELAERLAKERNLNRSAVMDYVETYNFRKQRGLNSSAKKEK